MSLIRSEARPSCRLARWFGFFLVTSALVVAMLPGAAGAAAKPKHRHFKPRPILHAVTLRYFQKATQTSFRSASGKALKVGGPGVAGAVLTIATHDFRGNHVSHAKGWVATGKISCAFSSTTQATCTNQIKVGGSEIDANTVKVLMGSPITTFAVNGGKGSYQNAKGLITATQVRNSANSDLTIVVLPSTSKHSG
ncbi:MAG: hypothetical protein ACRDYB_04960 [Acidimicrobiales bacterium]